VRISNRQCDARQVWSNHEKTPYSGPCHRCELGGLVQLAARKESHAGYPFGWGLSCKQLFEKNKIGPDRLRTDWIKRAHTPPTTEAGAGADLSSPFLFQKNRIFLGSSLRSKKDHAIII